MALKKETRRESYAEQIGVNPGSGFQKISRANMNRSNALDTLIDSFAETALTKQKELGAERAEKAFESFVPTYDETEINYTVNGEARTVKTKIITEPIIPAHLRGKTAKDVYEQLAFDEYAKSVNIEIANTIAKIKGDAVQGRMDGDKFTQLAIAGLDPLIENLSPRMKELAKFTIEQQIDTTSIQVDLEYNAYNATADNIKYTDISYKDLQFAINNINVADADIIYPDGIGATSYDKLIDGNILFIENSINTGRLTPENIIVQKERIAQLQGYKKYRKFLIGNGLIYSGEESLEILIRKYENEKNLELLTQAGQTTTNSVIITNADGKEITLTRVEALDWFNGNANAANSFSNSMSQTSNAALARVNDINKKNSDIARGEAIANGLISASSDDKMNHKILEETFNGIYKQNNIKENNARTEDGVVVMDLVDNFTYEDYLNISPEEFAQYLNLGVNNPVIKTAISFIKKTDQLPGFFPLLLGNAMDIDNPNHKEVNKNMKDTGLWKFIDDYYNGTGDIKTAAMIMNGELNFVVGGNTFEEQYRYLLNRDMTKEVFPTETSLLNAQDNARTVVDEFYNTLSTNEEFVESIGEGKSFFREVLDRITVDMVQDFSNIGDAGKKVVEDAVRDVNPTIEYSSIGPYLKNYVVNNLIELQRNAGVTFTDENLMKFVNKFAIQGFNTGQIDVTKYEMGTSFDGVGIEKGYLTIKLDPFETNIKNKKLFEDAFIEKLYGENPSLAITVKAERASFGNDYKVKRQGVSGSIYDVYFYVPELESYQPIYDSNDRRISINMKTLLQANATMTNYLGDIVTDPRLIDPDNTF
tara:strand:+ start:5764 stop:8223 length:2460 start_codon:yes stop_codon:yes gene_type:complete